MTTTQRIYTTCTRDCPNTCGLVATVDAGRLVRLRGARRHPLTRGRACAKAARYIERVYSPQRVRHPMLRASGKTGGWQRATWSQVLDRVAERMAQIIKADGPEAILYYQGYGERTALKLLNRYFFNLLGGVTTLSGSLCGGTGQAAQNLDLGQRISHDPLDHYNSNAVILWGRNPVSTNIGLVPIIRSVRHRGGTIILVDPYRSRSAGLADRHIAPAPGRDVFLAMAAAKLILDQGAECKRFLRQCSRGNDRYRDILNRFDFDDLCRRAGVSPSDGHFLAEVLINGGPAATLLGWGLHRHTHAHYTIRAIDALAAISGNIGVAGGGVSQGFEEYGPYDLHFARLENIFLILFLVLLTNRSCWFKLPPVILKGVVHGLGYFQQPVDKFMQGTDSLYDGLDTYTIPDYLRVMDIAKKVTDVIPCRLLRVHSLG